MLTLVLGTDWVANTRQVLQMVGEDVARERTGTILLVPELISHEMERRLCMAAGDTASRYAEVLSFTRLARRRDMDQCHVPYTDSLIPVTHTCCRQFFVIYIKSSATCRLFQYFFLQSTFRCSLNISS